MELAVLADIHSNHVALERCMGYALERGIAHFLFLGDYIGEFAYPERTMALLREYRRAYDCVFIRGNKEEYWSEYRDGGEKGWAEFGSGTGALYYAYHHLTQEDMAFFDSLPISRRLQYEGLPALIACHGSPTGVRGNMRPGNGETKRVLEASEEKLILYAHTHIQGKTVHMGKTALNPGAVGVPLQADGKTQFAILRGSGGVLSEEFVSLDYDRERVIRELYESGLMARAPYWCRVTEHLLRGDTSEEITHVRMLEHAMSLCEQETGELCWPGIPEKYWEQAARELHL